MMNDTMTKEEWELRSSEEDMIVENAEATCYLMLIQKVSKSRRNISKCSRAINTI